MSEIILTAKTYEVSHEAGRGMTSKKEAVAVLWLDFTLLV